MNIAILLIMIFECVAGIAATLYVAIGLVLYFAWKVLRKLTTGKSLIA